MSKLTSIGMYGISHHAINQDFGYVPTAECGADWACMRVKADDPCGDEYLCKNNIAFVLQIPYGSNVSFIDQWEQSEAAKRGLFVAVQCEDEPELHGISPAQMAEHIAAIRQHTSRPVWLNTFISERAYLASAEKFHKTSFKANVAKTFAGADWANARAAAIARRAGKYGNQTKAMPAEAKQWDALDYLECGQDWTTFDHYSAMGTETCSWLSTRDTFRGQVNAFAKFAPAGMTLGAICQAFNFNRCGVPDVDLEFMSWHLAQMREGFGEREFIYVHYAHEVLPSEGVFPPEMPALRETMRQFRAAALADPLPVDNTPRVGAGFTPASVTVEVGAIVGVSVFIPTGTKLIKIDTPDCVEGWPVDIINLQRWGTVNGVKPGEGEIVFTLDNGTATKLPVLVTPKAPSTMVEIKNGKFVVDLYLPSVAPFNAAHFRGEAELKLVE